MVPLTGTSAQAAVTSPDCHNGTDMYKIVRLATFNFDIQFWNCRGAAYNNVKAAIPQATDSKCYELTSLKSSYRGPGYYHWSYSPGEDTGIGSSGKLVRCAGTTDPLVVNQAAGGGGGGGDW